MSEETGRWICSKEKPYDPKNPEHRKHRWIHPDAKFLYEEHCSDETYEVYECPNCGLRFKVTVPR